MTRKLFVFALSIIFILVAFGANSKTAFAQACDATCQAQRYITQTGEGHLDPNCGVNSCTLLACTNGLVLDSFTYYPTPNCPIVQTAEDSYYDCPTAPPVQPTTPPVPTSPPPTPTTVPACGVPCSGNFACQGVRDGCTVCTGGVCSPPTTPTPKPTSTPVPTPTTVPACGVPCSGNFACQGAKNGCTVCGSNGTCQPPATPTQVPACGSPCSNPAACQGAQGGCTVCGNNGTCQPPATATPRPTSTPVPTATPTPIPFNPDSCHCDGIQYSNLASGQQTSITAMGKVEGSDVPRSQITSQTFTLYEGAETSATRIAISNPIPATIVSQDAGKVEYKSVWNFTMPQLKNGFTYRIQSQISCQPKVTAYDYSQNSNKAVLGASTENQGFFGSILGFLASLFGGNKPSNVASSVTSTLAPIVKTQESGSSSNNGLQLNTFAPTSVYQKTCTFIKFKVGT